MRPDACAALVLGVLVAGADPARAACADPAAVAAARAAADAQCSCAAASNHGQYVKCVRGVAQAAAEAGTLPRNCKGQVIRCAAKSTCGKPGFVTCCRTTAAGRTTCSIKKDASKCKAPQGGSASVGATPSCCDACGSPSGAFVETTGPW
jgi:hypothetical protein